MCECVCVKERELVYSIYVKYEKYVFASHDQFGQTNFWIIHIQMSW